MAKKISYYILVIFMSFAMTACSDDKNDNGYDRPPLDDDKSSLSIDESSLIGTWLQGHTSNYGNTNYISFDGYGNGQMVLVADFFTNAGSTGFTDSKETMGRLVYFSYSIIDNTIKILPSISSVAPFTITVIEQTKSTINLRFPADYNIGYHDFEKFNNNPNWFSEYGPATIDLTKNITGTYQSDDNNMRKFTVTKINDYTISIVDQLKGTTTTGQLYWFELYNSDYTNHPKVNLNSLTNPTYGLSPFYYFSRDGKLHVDNVTASKVE